MSSAACLFQRYRRKVTVCLSMLWIPPLVTLPSTAYVAGAAIGCFDVMVGRPQLLVIGWPAFGAEFGRMMQQRYGIHVRLLGCVTYSTKDAYAAGNNRVVLAVAEHKYGVLRFDTSGTWGGGAQNHVT